MSMRTLRELKEEAVSKVEASAIKKVLKFTRGKKTEAAQILEVDYKTLLTKIKQYDLSPGVRPRPRHTSKGD